MFFSMLYIVMALKSLGVGPKLVGLDPCRSRISETTVTNKRGEPQEDHAAVQSRYLVQAQHCNSRNEPEVSVVVS